jgi:hypothetical protein
MPSGSSPSDDAARPAATPPSWLSALPPAAFARQLWSELRARCGWHPQALTALDPLPQKLEATPAADLLRADHPWPAVLARLHALVVGYHPELGRGAERLPAEITALLAARPDGDTSSWAECANALDTLASAEHVRQRRIEQRLIDAAHGQWRSQRARQQAAQLLNRSMAGRSLPAVIVQWLQNDWFNELQWCLLHHGDTGSAWQRRADATIRLIASLQPPGDDAGARQLLYDHIPAVTAELRDLLGERSINAEAALALIEAQHLLLLKGRRPDAQPFKLISIDSLWFAEISLSRELLARIEKLSPGQWFLLREAPEARVRLILQQPEGGELLFVNQLGLKALQVTSEEFAYRLGADMAVPLPAADFWQTALDATLQALGARADDENRRRAEAAAALTRQREEVRARIEHVARQRAIARAKAAAEAKALAEAEASAAAAAAGLAAAEQTRLREQEQARRHQVQAQQAADTAMRQRAARLQATTLVIGQWLAFHDEAGQLQWLKLAVKLQTSGKLIFVDREGIRRAELSRDQLVERLLDSSAQIVEQGPHFEDSLSRVVDGLRRSRTPRTDTR